MASSAENSCSEPLCLTVIYYAFPLRGWCPEGADEVSVPLLKKMVPDILTDSFKIAVYFLIRIAQDRKPAALKKIVSLCIRTQAFRIIMLRSIQFNDDTLICAIEIDDIFSNYLLPIYCKRKCFQKIIPKMLFFPCHVFSQSLCKAGKLRIIQIIHYFPPPRQTICLCRFHRTAYGSSMPAFL